MKIYREKALPIFFCFLLITSCSENRKAFSVLDQKFSLHTLIIKPENYTQTKKLVEKMIKSSGEKIMLQL